MVKLYNKAKSSKVGETVICPSCGTSFVKTSYQQAFCKSMPKTMCKDKYWNTVDPKKRNNTTRISPASKRWINNWQEKWEDYFQYDDDPSWDAHKDSF